MLGITRGNPTGQLKRAGYLSLTLLFSKRDTHIERRESKIEIYLLREREREREREGERESERVTERARIKERERKKEREHKSY